MNPARRAGLVVAVLATALWMLFLVAVVTADPADGANIGAGLAALVALPLSVGSSVALLLSLRRGGRATTRLGAAHRAAAVLAALSIVCLVAFLLLDPYADSETLRTVTLLLGVGSFVVSSATFALRSP